MNNFLLVDPVLFLDFNTIIYLGLVIFVYWGILFDLQYWFTVVVLTMVFQRDIFDPTTIPVHVLLLPYPNNNNIVPYVQVHATTDTDTDKDTVPYVQVQDTDTVKCNFDAEWNAHVFYGYLDDVGIQVS